MAVIPWQRSRLAESLRTQQANIRREFKKYAPFDGDGQLISDVSIAASSSKEVIHNLKRKVRGWILISYRCDGIADGMVREVTSSNSVLELQNDATSDVIFDLWVF